MAEKPTYLDVDLKNKNYPNEPIFTQNDSNRPLILRITDDGEPVDLSKVTTITMTVERSDKVGVIVPGSLTEETNEVLFKLGPPVLSVTGRAYAVAQLYDKEGRASTLSFNFQVDRDPTRYIPDESDRSIIEIVLGEGPLVIQEAKDTIVNMNESLDLYTETIDEELVKIEQERAATANEREATEGVRIATEEERLATKEEREATEQVRQDTDKVRRQTEAVRDETITAKEQAEQATIEATNATDSANQSAQYANEQGQRAENASDDIEEVLELQQGPEGPQGPKGEKGDPGPQGEQGIQGNDGPAAIDQNTSDPLRIWTGTLDEYDAIENKDDSIIYMVRS